MTQSLLKRANYHGAIDKWISRHGERTILALVQFKAVPISGMPRVYLATPQEIGRRLHDTAKGRGDTVLFEEHTWGPRAVGAETTERIPPSWRFSEARAAEMFDVTRRDASHA